MKPFFKAAVRPENNALELMIYEDIGADYFGDGLTATSVKAEMDKLAGTYGEISVRINSAGGDVFEGAAIYNLLRASGRPITVYVDGIAASAASVIAMAGDKRVMGCNAMMMIHNAWSMCLGNAAEMRKMADTLEKVSESIAETYVTRTGRSGAEVQAMMDAETWMSAKDCLANGFATEIAEAEADADAMTMARGFKSLARLANVPEALKNDRDLVAPKAANANGCDCDCAECAAGDCDECSASGCDDPECADFCPMQETASNEAEMLRMSLYLRDRAAGISPDSHGHQDI